MPRVVETAPDSEVSVRTDVIQPQKPTIRAKVVYKGARRDRALPMKGRVQTDEFGEGEDKVTSRVATETGMTPYSFASHDLAGRPIKDRSRFMAPNHPKLHLRDRPFCWVEHPDHLYQFGRMRGPDGELEFEIVAASPADAAVLEEYFRRRSQAARVMDQDFAEITKVS